jgi:hypothetical protein
VAPKADIIRIAAAFELPVPDAATLETIREMLSRSGIGMYFKFLQFSLGVAKSQRSALTWEHFNQAYKGIRSLSR